ncbi:MAG: UDP-glucose 4-epimerase GalE [Pseudomonadota bacterium]
MKLVLITGGAGYIGSFCTRTLAKDGYEVVVYDNLSQGHRGAVPPGCVFEEGDLSDVNRLDEVFSKYEPDLVLHLAGFASIPESIRKPLSYYFNNVVNALHLLESMVRHKTPHLIFSSTGSTYGEPHIGEGETITEETPQIPIQTYGRTKLIVEKMIQTCAEGFGFRYVILRYFNVGGAMPDGSLGEDHFPETHAIPGLLETVIGGGKVLWDLKHDPTRHIANTSDGTSIRDYVHVLDLADAHLLAAEFLSNGGNSEIFNLGTKRGFSAKQVAQVVKSVAKKDFKDLDARINIEGAREGDPDKLIASNAKAKRILGWEPKHDLTKMVKHAYLWHKTHPKGFADEVEPRPIEKAPSHAELLASITEVINENHLLPTGLKTEIFRLLELDLKHPMNEEVT